MNDRIEGTMLTVAVLSALTDVIIAAFPIFFLRNLKVSFRTKLALCVLMGLGLMYLFPPLSPARKIDSSQHRGMRDRPECTLWRVDEP